MPDAQSPSLPILVANRQSGVAHLIASVLARAGFQVAEPVGPAAITTLFAPGAQFALAILDRGRDGAGFEVIADLRAHGATIPVILTSGSLVQPLVLPPGVWFLSKPFVSEHLVATVRAALSLPAEEEPG